MAEKQTDEECGLCGETHPVSEGITHFENHYHCTDCDVEWQDSWCCQVDSECPECHKDWTPFNEDGVVVVEPVYAEAA